MRLVKDRILHVWEQRRTEANERTTEQERRVKTIQQELDRLDEAFLYSESINLTSYSRQRDRLRDELTLAQIDCHTDALDELDVRVSWRSQNASCRAHQTCGSTDERMVSRVGIEPTTRRLRVCCSAN
jgi:hypothetical protein